MTSTNPYARANSIPPESAAYARPLNLEFGRALSFPFESPNWIVNVLLLALCLVVGNVIPVLPMLVIVGYQFEIIEALLLRPGDRYPDLKLERILEYVVRGLYPTLVAVIGMVVAIPLMFATVVVPIIAIGMISAAVGGDGAFTAIIMIPVVLVFGLIATCLLAIVLTPMVLRAGLSQDIGSAFSFAFVKDFARRMWKDVIWATLFMMGIVVVAYIVGLMLLCFGIFFTLAVVQLTQSHILLQLYRIYLDRGGEKIPLKVAEVVAV